MPFSYSQAVALRHGDTPSAVCFDHREPYIFHQYGLAGAELLAAWYHPDRPVIVLRSDGRIDTSRYGGLLVDGLAPSTLEYLFNL